MTFSHVNHITGFPRSWTLKGTEEDNGATIGVVPVSQFQFSGTFFCMPLYLRKYAKNFYIRRADPKAVGKVNKIAKTKLQADPSPLCINNFINNSV